MLKHTQQSVNLVTSERVPLRLAEAEAVVPRYIRLAELHRRVEALDAALQAALCRTRDLETRRRATRVWEQARGWILTSTPWCPACWSATLHRSHRRGVMERIFSFIALPFRCDDCGTRFFVSRIPRR